MSYRRRYACSVPTDVYHVQGWPIAAPVTLLLLTEGIILQPKCRDLPMVRPDQHSSLHWGGGGGGKLGVRDNFTIHCVY